MFPQLNLHAAYKPGITDRNQGDVRTSYIDRSYAIRQRTDLASRSPFQSRSANWTSSAGAKLGAMMSVNDVKKPGLDASSASGA